MSSDDAYASFLNKANADLSAGQELYEQEHEFLTSITGIRTDAVDATQKDNVPKPISDLADKFYISETDEPFESVALKWDGAKEGTWPDSCMRLLLYIFERWMLTPPPVFSTIHLPHRSLAVKTPRCLGEYDINGLLRSDSSVLERVGLCSRGGRAKLDEGKGGGQG